MRVNEHIARGHTVVCANVRLAHHFRRQYAQEQLRLGRRAWETPDILPWQGWLRRCRDSRPERNDTLLTPEQENVLWQQIIDASSHKNNLLQVPSMAAQVAAAWHRLKQYNAPIFPEGIVMNEDTGAFRSWADEYQSHCRQKSWVDNASLADVLRPDAAADPGAFGSTVVLAGFDRLTPQQAMLRKGLEAAGIYVLEYQVEDRNISALVADFADTNEEIRAAATWARRRIEASGGTTIGIITPDLRRQRNRIHTIFEDVLAPGKLDYRNVSATLPFNISVGRPLADYPLIHGIFPLIGLNKGPLTLESLGILLRTPFIKGHGAERSGRALLDEKLRSRKQLSFTWDELLYLVNQSGNKEQPIPILTTLLHELHSVLDEVSGRQSPELWAGAFTRLLEVCGWPGERSPDSAEYQQLLSWHSALDSLVSLRLVRPVMPRSEALSHVRRIIDVTSFQPETAETPIQVLDPHGSAAMAFDHIWMLGLSEESWPPRSRPNPFIPVALQKKYGMPGADAHSTMQQARHLQQVLVRSTPRIILSHARMEEDRPLLRSPLLRGLPSLAATETPEPGASSSGQAHAETTARKLQVATYSQVVFDSRNIETITDTQAPSVTGLHSGGASLFKDQSQCPFRAFARHRLHSRQLEQADIGLDPMERGNLLHQLLEDTWSRLKSQEELATMTAGERDELIETLVHGVITACRKRKPGLYTERFCAIESRRLAQILDEWLELELQRAPFTVVNLEDDARFAIADVEFFARLDRVDALADGRRVVIDYKSGRASVSDWAGDRPDEPQMPLYSVTHDEAVAAVAFARLKRGKDFGFAGLAESEGILPGVKAFEQDRRATRFILQRDKQAADTAPDWAGLLDNWRAVLQDLATEFRRGVATVTPKPRACDWCEQQPLCRIHEVSRNILQGAGETK